MRQNSDGRCSYIREAPACIGPVWKLTGDNEKPERNCFSDTVRAKSDTNVTGVHLLPGPAIENDCHKSKRERRDDQSNGVAHKV